MQMSPSVSNQYTEIRRSNKEQNKMCTVPQNSSTQGLKEQVCPILSFSDDERRRNGENHGVHLHK